MTSIEVDDAEISAKLHAMCYVRIVFSRQNTSPTSIEENEYKGHKTDGNPGV